MLFCICGKSYSSPPSLCVHRRNCEIHLEQKNKIVIKKNQNSLRLVELENEIKINQLENEKIQNEYKLQLHIKELQLQVQLQSLEMKIFQVKSINQAVQLEVQPQLQPQLQPVQEEKPIVNKLSTKEYLQIHCNNALTIEECYTYMKEENYNKYILEAKINDITTNIIAKNYFLECDWSANVSKNALDILEYFFTKLEKDKYPFYCSDRARNILYVKTEIGWLKNTEENLVEFDKYLKKLVQDALKSVFNSVNNTIQFFQKSPSQFKNLYDKNYYDWDDKNKHELILKLMLTSDDKEEEVLAIKKLKVLMSKMSIRSIDEE